MHRLHLLGRIELRDADGRELRPIVSQPKRLALLAYLAAAARRGACRRDELMGLFWPELSQDRARNALNKAVHFLRRALGDEAVVSRSGEELAVDGGVIWYDAAAFEEAVERGAHVDALALYQGDLLPAFYLPDTPAFEQWLEGERARLRRLAAAAARGAAESCEKHSQLTTAVGYARRAVELSDADERVVRELLSLLARLGDRAGAVVAYERFARRLSNELDVAPSEETQALIARIRAPAQSAAAMSPSSTAPAPGSEVDGLATTPEDRFASAGASARALTVPVAPVRSPWRAVARSVSRRSTLAVAGASAILLLFAAFIFSRSGPRATALNPDLLVIAPFEVLAPDLALWREGLADVLTRSLDGAGRLRTVSPSVALKSFRGRADASTSAALARRVGARLAMFGVLQPSGRDSVRVGLTVIDALSGRTIGEMDLRDAVDRIDRLVDSVSIGVMRLLSPGRSYAIRGIGTQSLPALKQYLQGAYWWRRYGIAGARDSASKHFERAIELDSGFALAWSALADLQTWPPPNPRRAKEFAFRGAALNHGLGPRDSMVLLGDSLSHASGAFDPFAGLQDPALWSHLTRFYALTDRLARENPRDAYLLYLYADVRFHMPLITAGVTDVDVLTAFDRAIAADSTDLAAWRHAVPLSYYVAGRAEGRRRLEAFARVLPDGEDLQGLRLNLRLDSAGALSDEALRTIWDAAGVDAQRASEREWLGSVASARDSGGVRIRLRERITNASALPSHINSQIWAGRLTYRGRLRDAAAIPQVRNAPAFSVLVKAGLVSNDSVVAALQGWKSVAMPQQPCAWLMDWWAVRADTASITTCVMHLRTPLSDTSVKWREPMVRALNAYGAFYKHLARRDSAAAVRALEIGVDTLCPLLCVAWQLDRAAALAAVGRREEALRIVRARLGQSEQRPVYPMMQLQRARLAMRLGDTATAMNAYSLVADAWTGADPELQPFAAEARRVLTRTGSDVASRAADPRTARQLPVSSP